MTQPTIDPHVIVDVARHKVIGLFTSPEYAVRACKDLLKYGDYKPMRIRLLDNVEFITMPAVPDSPEGIEFKGGDGGYI